MLIYYKYMYLHSVAMSLILQTIEKNYQSHSITESNEDLARQLQEKAELVCIGMASAADTYPVSATTYGAGEGICRRHCDDTDKDKGIDLVILTLLNSKFPKQFFFEVFLQE